MEKEFVLKHTFRNSLWVSKYILGSNIGALVIWFVFLRIFGSIGLFILLGLLDVILLGIIGIVIHKQYCSFERNRIINFTKNNAVVFNKGVLIKEINVKNIVRVVLIDKIINGVNSFPTFLDSYYYIVILMEDGSHFMVTCLMDPFLKDKIKEWSKVEMEHKNIFFPFLRFNSVAALFN